MKRFCGSSLFIGFDERILFLTVVGIFAVLAEVVLIQQGLWDTACIGIEHYGVKIHKCHLFHNHRIVNRLCGILAPGKWAVGMNYNSRDRNWVDVFEVSIITLPVSSS